MPKVSVRPSAALLIGALAFSVAMGGTGYAAAKISGRSIKEHTVAGNRLINNTVTGKQVQESTLATVPNAKQATNAHTVNGNSIASFDFTVASNSGTKNVSVPGGVLEGTCPSGVTHLLLIGVGASGESAQVQGWDAASPTTSFHAVNLSMSSTSGVKVSPDNSTTGSGTAELERPANHITTIQFGYLQSSAGCTYAGTVISN